MRAKEDTDSFLQASGVRGVGKKAAIPLLEAEKAVSSTKAQIFLEQTMEEMLREMDEDTGNFVIKTFEL